MAAYFCRTESQVLNPGLMGKENTKHVQVQKGRPPMEGPNDGNKLGPSQKMPL